MTAEILDIQQPGINADFKVFIIDLVNVDVTPFDFADRQRFDIRFVFRLNVRNTAKQH